MNPLLHERKIPWSGSTQVLNPLLLSRTERRIENPRFFRIDEKALAKAQRKPSKTESGTPERKKARKVVARIHERISSRRHNFAQQPSLPDAGVLRT
ncbi:MAG: transposase [Candidatus Methanoculleus thermohydrogenotrophicum]|jgi:transposase|nr:transposase [Candidatus Methanoculleus thermohydrogenotrophicum]NLM81758.1 transposase [Candidatus Methanoculleus thermohydrogenotrophicum]